jgi:hypothetical protein
MRINPIIEYRQKHASEGNIVLKRSIKKMAILIVLSVEIYFFIKMLI